MLPLLGHSESFDEGSNSCLERANSHILWWEDQTEWPASSGIFAFWALCIEEFFFLKKCRTQQGSPKPTCCFFNFWLWKMHTSQKCASTHITDSWHQSMHHTASCVSISSVYKCHHHENGPVPQRKRIAIENVAAQGMSIKISETLGVTKNDEEVAAAAALRGRDGAVLCWVTTPARWLVRVSFSSVLRPSLDLCVICSFFQCVQCYHQKHVRAASLINAWSAVVPCCTVASVRKRLQASGIERGSSTVWIHAPCSLLVPANSSHCT